MKQKNLNIVFFSLILTFFLREASLLGSEIQKQASDKGFFSSPKQAVPIIARLLKDEDFKTLASYYDLSNSELKPFDLESGNFFIRKKRPEIAHPAEFWHYKHPFSPGFKYNGMSSGPRKNVYLIHVKIIINQGIGNSSQEGYDSFYMIKSGRGWQILPDLVQEKGLLELPSMAPEIMPNFKPD